MENQHQKIKGYRELSQGEIDLMNKIKALASQCGDLIAELERADIKDADSSPDKRWISIGNTDLQKGFMALVRSVAKPTSF